MVTISRRRTFYITVTASIEVSVNMTLGRSPYKGQYIAVDSMDASFELRVSKVQRKGRPFTVGIPRGRLERCCVRRHVLSLRR